MESAPQKDRHTTVRWLIWLYFLLLIFEGAFRKWIIPSLSNQILLVRDPIVLLIYIAAVGSGCFPLKKGWLLAILILGGASVAGSVLADTFKPTVALYGFRTNFLHLPLIFVMGEALNIEDLKWLGRWTLRLAIPMAALMAAQFRVGDGHWLNVGAGEGASQIISALGKVRASGTFSFITGPVLFFPFATGFLFYSQLRRGLYSVPLIIFSSVSVGLAAACAGSRSLLGSIALEALGFFVAILFHPPSFTKAFRIVLLCGMTYLGISAFDLFKEATNVMRTRIELAAQGSPGFWNRILSNYNPHFGEATLFGRGLGVGTNVGAALMGRRGQFLIAENEWQRVVGESGLLLGGAFILLRLALSGSLLIQSLVYARRGNMLPMLMWTVGGMTLMNGQFGPPTILGFAVFVSGACLAACRDENLAVAKVDPAGNDEFLRTRKKARFEAPVHVGANGPNAAPPPRPKPTAQPGRWTVRPPGQETKV